MEKKHFPTLPVILSIALAIALGFGGYSYVQMKEYEGRLREIYGGTVLSALRQMEDMQLSLTKALLSNDSLAAGQYLHTVSSGAGQLERSISLLPVAHRETRNALKFANQLSDYTALLIGNNITKDQAEQMLHLITACDQSLLALSQNQESIIQRSARGQDDFYQGDNEENSYDSQVSYPTLIYDGPFSDGLAPSSFQALGQTEITREQAHQIAVDFIGADRVSAVSQGADMGGDIPCYGVTLHLHDHVTLECAVTCRGGKILWIAPDTADFLQEKSLEECRSSALSFLESRGYPPMESVSFQAYQGVMVIAFAPLQGETILYPDLIKVQLRMDNAQVVGVEARHYLTHHHPRGPLIPALSMEEAQGMVSDRLNITAARLCLIPKNNREILCYEFQGDYQGQSYLVYINADTGEQEDMLKIIENSAGIETV